MKRSLGEEMDFSKLKYISTDAPTTDELELLNESRVRIAQVIRARWIILGTLAVYGVVPYAIFQYYSIDLSAINALQFVFPVLAWCAMATYNAFFLYSYQWFANIRPLNQIQLLLDLLFVTAVIHYSGGAVSWFWPMYLVVTFESILVMEKYSDTFAFALGASLAYGGLLHFEFYGIIPPMSMPFENLSLQQNLPYEVTKLDIPCRYGGDEFAIIVPETTSAQATVVAERLRKEINVKCGHEMMAQIQAATGSHPMEVPDVLVPAMVAG
jgi:hypothetical protein